MKKLIFILISVSLLLTGCGLGKEVEINQLIKRGDIFYEVGKKKPFTGKVVEIKNRKLISELKMKKGKANGEFISYYQDGKKSLESNYKNGQLDGKFISYYQNGKKTVESSYKDGQLDGRYRAYYYDPTGKEPLEKDINYKKGDKVGKLKIYYQNGQLKTEEIYNKNGQLDGNIKFYFEDGNIEGEGSFKNGMQIGIYKLYYPNGNLKYQQGYRDGNKDGIGITYDSTGKIISEYNYKNDQLEGIQKEYQMGTENLIKEENYQGGNLISYKRYSYFFENDKLKEISALKVTPGRHVYDGEQIIYYPDGKVGKYDNYKEGIRLEGKIYAENGNLIEERKYRDFIRKYDDEGNLRSEIIYENEEEKYEKIYVKGILDKETIYEDRKRKYTNGYDKSGNLREKTVYGEENQFVSKFYNEQGKMLMVKTENKVTTYSEDGEILSERNY